MTFQVVDETSDPPAPLSAVTATSFDVAAEGEMLLDRIRRDYDDGVIAADDAARDSLLSAIDPDYRAEPYVDYYTDDVPEDPQALALFAATLYAQVSPETLAELDGYLTDGPPVPESASGERNRLTDRPDAAVAAAPAAPYPGCVEVNVATWKCVTEIDSSDPETGGDPIAIKFIYFLGDNVGRVPDFDQDANQRPDRIDALVGAFVEAWRFYRDDLQMDAIDDPFTVHLARYAGGLSVPGPGGSGAIFMPPTATSYLVRHELFHQVEYQYLSAADIAAHYHPMHWLLEAAAEWASYEAEQRLGPGDGRAGLYALDLPAALGAPHRAIDDTDEWQGGPEYGSFPFIEYLDQAHGGHGMVESVLAGSGAGPLGKRPTDVIADLVPSWPEAIVDYRQWTYLLTRDTDHGVGFAAPDSDGDGVNDVDQYWRAAL